MSRAARLLAAAIGLLVVVGGTALFIRGSKVMGALLVLLGAMAVVISISSERGEAIWETVSAWLSQLP